MALGIYDTAVLTETVELLDSKQPAPFLLELFPTIQTSSDEKIYFDSEELGLQVAPFVHPDVAGQVVESPGYSTKSLAPAYVKDKRRLKGNAPLKRMMGEPLTGNLSPMARQQARIRMLLQEQIAGLTRREILMAKEALISGTVTISGDKYPSVTVSFGRDASLTKTLSGGAAWGQSGVDPFANMETWAAEVQNLGAGVPTVVIMEPGVWTSFIATDAKVEKHLDFRRGTNIDLTVAPSVQGTRGPSQNKARFRGVFGDFELWTYQDVYHDPTDGTLTNVMPANQVIMVDPTNLQGTRGYGVIQDEAANFSSERFFAKSWLDEDPGVRWMLLQSAPLVFPYRPNASMSAVVA